jgi:cell wall-associated NlpC family hydrolase
VELAAQRQAALEQRQREEAAAQAPAPAPAAPEQPAAEPEQPAAQPDPEPDPAPTTEQPAAEPAPVDPTPPPASSGASAAVSFARAQIGEPYVWAADGPDSWDCSGLTMRAWEAGGKYLPHYSVAQYEQSTPIASSQLRPGDLVFWGDSPGSIYHVAIYSGNGMIIHAPRTGRDVEEVSMYYWIAPDYFARP